MQKLLNVKTSQVSPDPNQPRKRFAAETLSLLRKSIEKYGIKNPLLVEETDKGGYLIVDGERRYRVATDLGLKELPVIVEGKKGELDRIVEQFHIQEQHEAWTTTEKASVVLKLAEEMKMPMKEVGNVLGLTDRQVSRFASFGKLIDKESFQEKVIDVAYAEKINSLRDYAKKALLEQKDKELSKQDQARMEKVIVNKIVSGEIEKIGDFTKLKDSFRKNPDSIAEFLEGKATPEQLFIKTKAKGAYYLRNMVNSGLSLQNCLAGFMAISDTKVTSKELALMKEVSGTIKKFLDRYGE